MITPAYCAVLARYGEWMNQRLHALAGEMSDEERRRDRRAFFGSIHETCNHLLWGDRIWLARFTGQPFAVGGFGRGMFDDFTALRRERAATDATILQWAGTLDPAWLGGTVRYTSAVDGRTRTLPAPLAAMHFFNHATHHRGQLTMLLTQAGRDPGVTDLPWVPGVLG